MEGWIKIHRKLLEWEWYDDCNVFRLFFHLLLTVNYEDKNWHGTTIQAGQIITSVDKLAGSLHLSTQQIRTAINKLKNTGEITSETTNKYTIITICNFAKYQSFESVEQQTKQQTNNNQITNEQQTNNNQITTTKEDKEYKKERKEEIIDCADAQPKTKKATKKKYGEFENVLLTDEEAQKLHNEFGNDALAIVQNFSDLKAMKGYKYKSDYLAIRKWGATAYYELKNRNNNGNNGTSNRTIQERAERIAEFAFAANGL